MWLFGKRNKGRKTVEEEDLLASLDDEVDLLADENDQVKEEVEFREESEKEGFLEGIFNRFKK